MRIQRKATGHIKISILRFCSTSRREKLSKLFILLALSLTTLNTTLAKPNSRFIIGAKYPNTEAEGTRPVYSKAIAPDHNSFKGGYNDLLPFVTASPDQENAGSCLFMSSTGIVEWWHAKMNPQLTSSEDRDLSERYFMNLSKEGLDNDLNYWPTDMIYALNKRGKIYRNEDYRYTKGWYKKVNGKRVPALENEDGAYYGVPFSWISLYKNLDAPMVKLPKFEREIIFKDPAENRWNVTTAPKDIVSKIKRMIKKRNAPVLAIYNHVGFWHATMIVGFNDHASTEGCPFVGTYDERMNKRADEIVEEANLAQTQAQKKKLLRKAKNFRRRGKQVEDSYQANGGCSSKGVFYVRDSIYSDPDMPLYDYDLTNSGEETNLNAPVILREYEWAEQLINHAYQIYPL